MKKNVTLGKVARALSRNMFAVGLGMMVCSSVAAIVGCIAK